MLPSWDGCSHHKPQAIQIQVSLPGISRRDFMRSRLTSRISIDGFFRGGGDDLMANRKRDRNRPCFTRIARLIWPMSYASWTC
jgi:hypothetical protein